GRQQVAGLREQSARGLEPVVAAAFPLEAAGIRRYRKAHAAFDGLDTEMGEQRRQVRIVQLVIDDEADVDRKPGAVIVDAHRIAVAAGPELAVVDSDRIVIRQGPGCGIATDSRPDHREAHFWPSLARARYGRAVPGVSNRPQFAAQRGKSPMKSS